MSPWTLSFAAHAAPGGPAGYGWCLCRTGEPDSLSGGSEIVPPPFAADHVASALVACGKALAACAEARTRTPPPWPPVTVLSHHAAAVALLNDHEYRGPYLRLLERCWQIAAERIGFTLFEVLESEGLNGVAAGRAKREAERDVAA